MAGFYASRPFTGAAKRGWTTPSIPLLIAGGAVIAGLGLGAAGLWPMVSSTVTPWLPAWMQASPALPGSGPLRTGLGVSEADIYRRYIAFASESLPMGTSVQDDFNWLRAHAPGLEPLVRLHASALFAAQPDEGAAQRVLDPIKSDSHWGKSALYRIGQSQVRANMPTEATQTLETLRQRYPNTAEAASAAYYLAELTKAKQPAKSREWVWTYLEEAAQQQLSDPFASALAMSLANEAGLTPKQRGLVGLALLRADEPTAAQQVLAGSNDNAWILALASANDNQRAKPALQQTIALWGKGPLQPTEEQRSTLLHLIQRWIPAREQVPLLQHALASNPPHADALLWTLAQAQQQSNNITGANATLSQLLSAYPQSDYAPESLRQQVWQGWPAAISNPKQAGPGFIQQAKNFVQRYPYARAAAELAYWQGKLQEKLGDVTAAKTSYQAIIRDYPLSYYGHRAQQRLKALASGATADTQWQLPTAWAFPGLQEPSIHQLQGYSAFTSLPASQQQALQALLAMAAATHSPTPLADAQTLLSSHGVAHDDVLLATVAGWQSQLAGQPHVGVRRVYDALLGQSRQGTMAAYKPEPLTQWVLYPVLHGNALPTRAQATGVPAMLGLALMREESFFNTAAVSSSNALGLMQLLPSTAADVAKWENIGFTATDLYDPNMNIRLGMRYLQYLFEKFKPYGPAVQPMLAVGAYNGGPNAMARWASTSRYLSTDPDVFVASIPYEQTRTYIQKVFTSLWTYDAMAAQRN